MSFGNEAYRAKTPDEMHIESDKKCGAKAARQPSAPAIQFKGSGWYVTDYAGKNAPPAEKKESGGDGASSKSEEKSSESKPAAEKSSPKKEK